MSDFTLLLDKCYDLVSSCTCDSGCPSCVGPDSENGYGGKPETLFLLELLKKDLMTDLKDRLKKLGLTSARDIPTPSKPVKAPLEELLDGKRVSTIHGDVIVIERLYPYGTTYGNLTLRKPGTINELYKFAGKRH